MGYLGWFILRNWSGKRDSNSHLNLDISVGGWFGVEKNFV